MFIYFSQKNANVIRYVELQSESKTVILKKETINPPVKITERIVKNSDSNFEEYDQMEKNWLEKAENILGKKDFLYYEDLRKRNDEEKMNAYKEFHNYLRQKNGDNFSYHLSEDQSIREKTINTKYTREFIKRIGEEKFKNYLKARDEFNEGLRRKAKEGHALIIEF
jgi:glutamyl-tRNA reductase